MGYPLRDNIVGEIYKIINITAPESETDVIWQVFEAIWEKLGSVAAASILFH